MRFYDKYSSINDLPVFIWEKIHETGNLSLLFKNRVKIDNNEKLSKIWANIYNEYLNEFGLSKEFKEVNSIKLKIAKLKADFIISNNRLLINNINVEENALKSLRVDGKGKSLKENIVFIEKYQGVKQNTMELTVSDYYNYLRIIHNG